MSKVIEFPLKNVSLNQQQYDLVTNKNINENKLILACAGSGKTLTITSRICYMINNFDCEPEDFIVCTFNRNAAAEMRKRINNMIGMTKIKCGTFHSIGLKLLNNYDYLYLEDNYHIDETQTLFLDFLKSDRSNALKENIKYIFIDEFQDVNNIQLQIIKQFKQFVDYLYFVGDDLQNIYTFRGSNNDIILNINTHFPKVETIKMLKNYRCTDQIINLANNIQSKNRNNINKKMTGNENIDKKPHIYKFKNLSKEIKFIISSIIKDLKKGLKKKDICILSRNNIPLFFIEEQLQIANIKNKILNTENIIQNSISLSTIHSAKGLEWKKIYLIGMNDSYFPHPKCEVEEERRLFYVAITRCKKNLVITFNESDKCSRLLTELDEDLFKKDFVYKDLINIERPLEQIKEKEQTVTGIINKLTGDDYIKLKKLNIFKDINFKENRLYKPYNYPIWVIENDYFSDFGSFIDYLIRRMIGDFQRNKDLKLSGLRDKRADDIILSITLTNANYYYYLNNLYKFKSCYRLYKSIGIPDKHNIKNMFNQIKISIDRKELDKLYEILQEILYYCKKFKVKPDEVNITNKFYLPFDFNESMRKNYLKYTKSKYKWNEIIWEIFMVSKCHSIWGNRRKNLYMPISKKNVNGLDEFYKEINKYLNNKMEENKVILCNPKLNNGIIFGDADLIVHDELIDFKVSNNTNLNIEHILQLLIYASLARYKGITVNKISIYNPLKGIYYVADITNWEKEDELVEYLINKLT